MHLPEKAKLAVILSGLLTAACAETPGSRADKAYDLADAAQVNARTALGRLEEQDGRIEELEKRIKAQAEQIEFLVSDRDRLNKDVSTLFENDQKLQDRLDSMRRY